MFGLEGLGSGREYLNIDKVVQLTGLSQTRIRQREEAGTFPTRVTFGPRAGLWLRDQVRAWVQEQRNPTTTPQVSTTPPRKQPLKRIVDKVVILRPWRYREATEYHLRIFAQRENPLEGVVVVLSKLPDSLGPSVTNAAEALMASIDAEYLAGAGAGALWFETYSKSGSGLGGPYVARNIVATKQGEEYVNPIWPPTMVRDIDKVIGMPLEWYPEKAHTRATIERWQRNDHTTVDVVHDQYELGDLVMALQYLHTLPESDPHRRLASELSPLVAHRFRIVAPLQEWRDGTTSGRPEDDESPEWPGRFAARITPYAPTPQMQRILDEYPTDDEHGDFGPIARKLVHEFRSWIEEVDRYSDNPDPVVFHHLRQILTAIAWPAQDLEIYIPEHNPTQLFVTHGTWDERFLAAVEERPELEHQREGRMLRASMGGDDRIRYGRAPGGHAVAWSTPEGYDWVDFAVLWPMTPKPFPEHAHLVASGGDGNLPVYVAIGDTIVDLLTRSTLHNGWNFGYGGGGPGQLEYDIARQLATHTGLERGQMPKAWIEDQVERASKDYLDVRVDDAVRRVVSA